MCFLDYLLLNLNLSFPAGQRLAVVGLNGAGKTTITFETLSENTSAQTREATITVVSPEDDTVSATLVVSQQSNIILPPSELQAEAGEGSVTLSWTAPQEGTPVLSEGFEDVANLNWTISNYNDRGWYLTESSKYYLAYHRAKL